jgi:hypothetical protein
LTVFITVPPQKKKEKNFAYVSQGRKLKKEVDSEVEM